MIAAQIGSFCTSQVEEMQTTDLRQWTLEKQDAWGNVASCFFCIIIYAQSCPGEKKIYKSHHTGALQREIGFWALEVCL